MKPRRIATPKIDGRQPCVTRNALTSTLIAGLAAATLSSAAAGCQSRGGGSAPSEGSAPDSQASHVARSAKPLDVCSMLSPQDISALLGTAASGKPRSQGLRIGGCSWENPSTEESVSVQIGRPDSALNNTLAPPEPGFPDPTTPGPDGMRFLGGGGVEFAAGNRSNTVQVAVLRFSPDQANSAALDLAKKIVAQVPR